MVWSLAVSQLANTSNFRDLWQFLLETIPDSLDFLLIFHIS